MSALRTRQPIHADTAATVGVVMEIVAAALARPASTSTRLR